MRFNLWLIIVLAISSCAAYKSFAPAALQSSAESEVIPSPCVPPGWKTGDSVVFGWVYPCLDDQGLRERVQAVALSGSIEASKILAHYYAFKDDSTEKAIFWYRNAISINATCISTRAQLSRLLVERGSSSEEVAEGVSIAAETAMEGETGTMSLLVAHYRSKGEWENVIRYERMLAYSGDLIAMIDLSKNLLKGWSKAADSSLEACAWLDVARERSAPGSWLDKQVESLRGKLLRNSNAINLTACKSRATDLRSALATAASRNTVEIKACE